MNKFLLLIALFLFSIQNSSATLLQDEFVEQLTCDKEIETYSNYNFESTTRITSLYAVGQCPAITSY